jgi:hypothetical protein
MTTQVYTRLDTAIEGAAAALAEGNALMAQFNRKLLVRLLRGRLCPTCEANYCAASAAAYVLEGDGVWVEPVACPDCDGWALRPSAGEVEVA